jgi:HlyD family secretion protein
VNIRRWLILLTLGAIVLLSIVYGFLPKPVTVDEVEVTRGPLRVTIEEEGETRVKDRFVVSAPVAGFLRRIELEVGDPVKDAQVVARLEPLRSDVLDPRSRAEAEAAVSAAMAAVRGAEERVRAAAADAEYLRRNLDRQNNLFEAGVIPKDRLDQAMSDARRTEAGRLAAEETVKGARSDLDRARSRLRYSAAEGESELRGLVEVRTPSRGSVLKIHRESEGVVSPGEALLDIGDTEGIEVKVEVLSEDGVRIKPGTPVVFDRWGGDSSLRGVVRTVEPAGFTKVSSLGVEEQRVLVIADIDRTGEAARRLGDGYRVEASFIVWEGSNVLQVPASALFRRGEDWAVFLVEGGKARLRKIQVGHRTGLSAEVVAGLREGERVIAHPEESIEDGTGVRSRPQG